MQYQHDEKRGGEGGGCLDDDAEVSPGSIAQ